MQKISQSVQFVMMAAAVSLAAPGCAVDAIDDDGIATVDQALGETGCETATKNADGTWGFESISAGNMYDPAGCPDQYLVGWGDLPSGQNAFADVFWEGTAPTASNCADSHLSLACYSLNTGWAVTATQVFDGVWSGGTCTFVFSSGSLTCPLNGDNRNRTAAKAWVRTCSGGTCTNNKRKVGVRAWQS